MDKLSTDDLLVDLIQTTHDNDIAGASMSSTHPNTGGAMVLLYFHPEASEDDVRALMAVEVERVVALLDPDAGEPLPPKDPRNMH